MLKRRKKRDCGCSGHPSGHPKITMGPCFGYGLRKATRERITGKKIVRAWLVASDVEEVDD